MDKYERRRLRLKELKETRCNDRVVDVATKIDRDASYVSRLLYPAGKAGAKRIADDMMEVIEKAFDLPRYWLDQEPGAALQKDAVPAQEKSKTYNEYIQAVIDLMLTLKEGHQGYIHKAVVDTIKELTPAEKDKQQKVAGQTGK